MKGETIEVQKERLVALLRAERELYILENSHNMTSSEEWDAWHDLDTKSDDELIKYYLY